LAETDPSSYDRIVLINFKAMKPRLVKAYMDIAERFAQVSECQRLKVGAIVVKNGSILAHGWNGTPSGYKTNACELEDGTTSPFVLHAEQNALVKMAKSTESIEGAELFCTHSPCPECSKLIAQSGVKKVFYREAYRITEGLDVLEALGVAIEQVK
jgi:dCMP deaminase